MAAEKPSSRGQAQAWFCTVGLPSDVVIEVDDMSFHLHKFPLMSKSGRLNQLILESEQSPRQTTEGEIAAEDESARTITISLPDFPGGLETFETAAKFCYGVKIELTSWNVIPLRCAAEYLSMTDEIADDNLISRTDKFLSQSVLRNLTESVKALKSCEPLIPMAEDLGVLNQCIDSIAARASSSDPAVLFGWPISDARSSSSSAAAAAVLWNGIDTGARRRSGAGSRRSSAAAADSWFEDLTVLSLPIYKRVIAAMKSRDPTSSVIEESLVSYAKRSIPGLSRRRRGATSAPVATEAEQRELLETVITNLPPERSSDATDVRFLFGLVRTASILRASEGSRRALERRIAGQLEGAAVDDLLVPSYSYLVDTLYDVECVERILRCFVERVEEGSGIVEDEEAAAAAVRSPPRWLIQVGKLVDGYLAEIASDANLKVEKFCDLASLLPDRARLFDDGLYRAVDIYLKAHPRLSEEEREKACGAMDCQKLTLEACTHAAQNERLPLRAIVQVLFFEQLQLRQAIAGTLLAAAEVQDQGSPQAGAGRAERDDHQAETWRSAVRQNQVLRLDMDSMRGRVHELERECSSMKRAIEKVRASDVGPAGSGWSSLTRRFGCKFKTQVCDSHERTAVEERG